MVALTSALLSAAQPVAPAAIPLPRFAAPPGLGGAAWSPSHVGKLEAQTPETQSPRSGGSAESSCSEAQSPAPSPRVALESTQNTKKIAADANALVKGRDHAALGKRPCVAAPPGLEGDAVQGPSLVQVFAELRERQEDPHCILKLRKVQLLGVRPMEALERHFGRMPGFERVVVVYSHMKIVHRGEAAVRCKPSGLAFVVFASRDFARRALAVGAKQTVDGATLCVERYEPKDAAPEAKQSMDALAPQIVEGARFAL